LPFSEIEDLLGAIWWWGDEEEEWGVGKAMNFLPSLNPGRWVRWRFDRHALITGRRHTPQ
jgi:hypothetical protein